jgi:molybdenum cofactor guanylyltransferase
MTAEPLSLTTLVLVGGHSRRMGTDKALLLHPRSGSPLLLHQLALLQNLHPAARCVAARLEQRLPPLPADVQRIDDDGQSGPLAGIVNALDVMTTTHLLVLAIDLPAMDLGSLQRLVSTITPHRGAVAQTPLGLEPLIAIYPQSLQPAFHHALTVKRLGLRRLLAEPTIRPHFKAVNFAPAYAPFLNWNTPH